MNDAVLGLRLTWRTAVRAERRRLFVSAGLIIGSGAIGGSFPLWSKLLIDSVLSGLVPSALWAAVLLAMSWVLAMGMSNTGALVLYDVRDVVDVISNRSLILAQSRVTRLDDLERPAYQDRLTLARSEPDSVSRCLSSALWAGCLLLQTTVTAVLLATVSPALLGLPLLALAAFLIGTMFQRRAARSERATAGDQRRAVGFFSLATDPEAGPELRVFGLPGEVLRRHAALWESIVRTRTGAESRAAIGRSLGLLVVSLGFLGALAFVALGVPRGDASLGDLLLVYNGGQQAYLLTGSSVLATTQLYRAAVAVARIDWLLRFPDEPSGSRPPATPPGRLRDGVVLNEVTFRYDGASRAALEDVSVRIPAGSVVAVVGHNGAGKSTLVKILSKLYEPTAGTVGVDGVDLATMASYDWQTRLTGAFQDYARFELAAHESVGVGHLPAIDDRAAVRRALQRASYTDLEIALPDGLDTPVGGVRERSIGLSGGQWQRLALARSLMPPAPLIIFLDEPTASLDPEAENDIFRRYAELAAEGAADGRITVLVTHRFSTVRNADLILVLEDGRLVETGHHNDLIRLGGTYAAMYRLQADGYR